VTIPRGFFGLSPNAVGSLVFFRSEQTVTVGEGGEGKKAPPRIASVHELIGVALGLGAGAFGQLSKNELRWKARVAVPAQRVLRAFEESIRCGDDPLGDALQELLGATRRRERGAVYTPQAFVDRMLAWGRSAGTPTRVVDPGTGSARFLLSALRAFGPTMPMVGIELDPRATLVARANLHIAGADPRRAVILNADFCRVPLPRVEGTLWVGNPPYVRHQQLSVATKKWLSSGTKELGVDVSPVMGLHGYFVLRIATLCSPRDRGALLLPAEWLDAHYGASIQRAFIDHLGGVAVNVLDREQTVFGETRTTSAVVFFNRNEIAQTIAFRRVSDPADLASDNPKQVITALKKDLKASGRWSLFLHRRREPERPRLVELRTIADVRRGIATGHNAFFVRPPDDPTFQTLPDSLLVAVVSRARELTDETDTLASNSLLKRLLVTKGELENLPVRQQPAVKKVLAAGRRVGVHERYLCAHRHTWHSVPLPWRPPDLLATYMSRGATHFVRNVAGAYTLNIAHGISLHSQTSAREQRALVRFLQQTARSNMWRGREYSTGLIKLEPTELGRTLVPDEDALSALGLLVDDESALREAIKDLTQRTKRAG
jgi:adenine-specific DNA-methyltransferase